MIEFEGEKKCQVYMTEPIFIDLLEDQTHWSAYKKHWKTLLQGKNVHSFLDVSIGSGSVNVAVM